MSSNVAVLMSEVGRVRDSPARIDREAVADAGRLRAIGGILGVGRGFPEGRRGRASAPIRPGRTSPMTRSTDSPRLPPPDRRWPAPPARSSAADRRPSPGPGRTSGSGSPASASAARGTATPTTPASTARSSPSATSTRRRSTRWRRSTPTPRSTSTTARCSRRWARRSTPSPSARPTTPTPRPAPWPCGWASTPSSRSR